MSEELKPCPFCGCAPVTHNRQDAGDFIVECDNPACTVNPCVAEDSEAAAVDGWNTRPNDAVIAAAQKVADLGRARGVAFLSTDIPVLHRIALELAALLPPKERS